MNRYDKTIFFHYRLCNSKYSKLLKMIKKAIQNEVFWGLLLVNCSLVYFIDRQLFLVDLLKSVAVQAIMGFILISVFAAVFRYTKLASLTGLSAFLIFASMLVQPDEARQARCSPSDFKVAHFNVFLHNHSYTQLAKNALETEADLLSFQEVTNRWAYTLEESLKDIYPHYCISPREDSFGIAVFSKFPLENLAEPQWQGRPNISANILFGNQSIHFVTAHTASPISPSRYRKRNAHINDIATWLEQIPEPKLAIGDFNCVSWSPQIRNFKTVIM